MSVCLKPAASIWLPLSPFIPESQWSTTGPPRPRRSADGGSRARGRSVLLDQFCRLLYWLGLTLTNGRVKGAGYECVCACVRTCVIMQRVVTVRDLNDAFKKRDPPHESCTARLCIHVCPCSPHYTLVCAYMSVCVCVCICAGPLAACGDWKAGGHGKRAARVWIQTCRHTCRMKQCLVKAENQSCLWTRQDFLQTSRKFLINDSRYAVLWQKISQWAICLCDVGPHNSRFLSCGQNLKVRLAVKTHQRLRSSFDSNADTSLITQAGPFCKC